MYPTCVWDFIAEFKESYRVKNINGEFFAKITGKQIFNASGREDYPAVGDWVLIEEIDDEKAVIKNILPRQTIVKRKTGKKNFFWPSQRRRVYIREIQFLRTIARHK